LVHSRN